MRIPRFYPILDIATLQTRDCPVVDAAEALLEAGAAIIQFRHKGPFTRSVFDTADQVAELCRQAGSIFIVNDRADIALMLDAGVHLGQDDLTPVDARRVLGGARVMGLSTHNPGQFAAALLEPVEYVAIGPVFGTASKANADPAVGLEMLRQLAATTSMPVVAIGGITLESAPRVWDAGATSVAVIGDLYPEGCNRASIRRRAESWMVV